MAKYLCSVCGYVYDEATGITEVGIAPGTAWEDLPDDWVCPICGAGKAEFEKQGEPDVFGEKKSLEIEVSSGIGASEASEISESSETSADMKEMSPLEISALCTNLARGCEKQYKPEEAGLFRELAAYFKAGTAPAKAANFDGLLALVERNLEEDFPNAHSAATGVKDRGALRALVWSEKVTRILKSLLTRYQKEGDAMLENTHVYVCTICGFIYIGDKLPEICPVCKVPSWKFEKVEGGQQ